MMSNLFYNSEYLFIEYNDIIKAPSIRLLQLCKLNPMLRDIMDFSIIDLLNYEGLCEWYKYRKNRNPFKELMYNNINISDDELDEILYCELNTDYRFFDYSDELVFTKALNIIIRQKLVKNILIYSEKECANIKTDINNLFGTHVFYKYGEFKNIIETIPNDTTFILSDINKVNIIKDNNKLNFSTIIIPNDYRYNKLNMNDFKIDFVELNKDYVFKYGFITAFSV